MINNKLQGKIRIWTGDMDGLYSNVTTLFLKMFHENKLNPKSYASIHFTPMAGHSEEWSDEDVLVMVGKRLRGNLPCRRTRISRSGIRDYLLKNGLTICWPEKRKTLT
ncbi:MAG: hypothetical protein M0Q53_10700 [Prolixibacteraceae bacterium]|nr:hypothetical protein [Prolixibacteraceae bacterium]